MSEPLDIPEPSFFEKIGIRWRLFKNNTVSDLERRLQFTVGRSKLVSSDREHYLYSANHSMFPVKCFCVGFAVAMLAFVSTRKSKSRFGSTPMRRIFHSLFWGYTAGLFYGPLTKVSRFEDVCNLDDSYFAKVARDIIRTHPEAKDIMQVIHFDSPDVQRNLYLQPNYRHSGFPAIITTPVNEPAPEGAIFLPEKDFLNEAVWAWNKKTEQENMTEENAAKLGDLDEWRVPKYLQDVGVDVYLMPPRRPTKS